jgi:hypothetical protein
MDFSRLRYEKNPSLKFTPARIVNMKVVNIWTWGTLLVAQLVETLRYKPEGRGFDSRWCH